MNLAVAAPSAPEREFAKLLAEEIIKFEPEDLSDESLALQFTLSAYMRSCEIGLFEVESALAWLRHAVVSASGLSLAEEPVPLLLLDRKQRVMNICHYTYGLVGRAAAQMGLSKPDVLRAAIGG